MESTPAHLVNIDQTLKKNATNFGLSKLRRANGKPMD
jgi:hypothetical protein